jgi:hypothetical protein
VSTARRCSATSSLRKRCAAHRCRMGCGR